MTQHCGVLDLCWVCASLDPTYSLAATSTTAGYSNRTVAPSRRALTPMVSPSTEASIIARSPARSLLGVGHGHQALQLGGHRVAAQPWLGQACIAEQGQVPRQRPKLHRGGVAVALHPVEGRRLGRIIRADGIAQHDAPAGAAHADHLGEGGLRRLEVMEGVAAADDVEGVLREGQRIGIARVPRHVRESPLRRQPPRLGEHGLGGIQPCGAAHMGRKRAYHRARPARHVEGSSSGRGRAALTRISSAAWLCSAGEAANCSAWRVN